MNWLAQVIRRDELERRLDVELRFDYDQRLAFHLHSGLSESEARRAVRLEFGGLEQLKEDCRDARAFEFLHSFFRDARYAVRGMRRSPGFFILAISILAVGIGINATVFTIMNTVLFKGFPLVNRNDRILYISTESGVSYPDFEDWRAEAKSFSDLALAADLPVSLSDNFGFPESYTATRVSANAFQVIGQKPLLGRDFSSSSETADDKPGAAPVAILTYAFWERRYGKDPAILGRSIRVNGVLTTVIGVMPSGFTFPERQELWVPLIPTPALQKRNNRSTWFAFGRMKPGVTLQSVRTEMTAIGKRLELAYPLTNQGFAPDPRTFAESFIGPTAPIIYSAMWGAVSFVLLIACANLANLLLARAMGRTREIFVRIAIGAGRWRIFRQLLIESVILSGFGGFFGWWLAQFGVRAYEALVSPPAWFDHVLAYRMDYRVLGYLIVISVATGMLFGLAPAARFSKLDVNATLKDGGRNSTAGNRVKHLSNLLVIAEMALAIVLLAGAGVMVRSFLNIYNANLGVKPTNVLTGYLTLPDAKYPNLQAHIAFFDRLSARLQSIPGVDSVAFADTLPTYSASRIPYELAGLPALDDFHRPKLSAVIVSPSYFRTLGAAVLSGREFNDADLSSSIPAAIVNQQFAAKFWPGQNPLGKRLRLFAESETGQTPQSWLTVVGIASNIVQFGRTHPELDTLVYLPYRQRQAAFLNFFVRTHIPSASIAVAIRRQVQSLDADLPVSYYMPLAERMTWGYNLNRSMAALFLIFAAIALLLAALGLYAVLSHAVVRRTQEIGIRAAMGATSRDILKLILRQGMLPVVIGLAVGLVASLAVMPILKSQLVRVSPFDPAALASTAIILVAAAVLGCTIPARRATRVDPAIALRHE